MRVKKTLTSRVLKVLDSQKKLTTEEIHKHVNFGMNKKYRIARSRVSNICKKLYYRNRLNRPDYAVYSTLER